jgi:hypothetical protein
MRTLAALMLALALSGCGLRDFGSDRGQNWGPLTHEVGKRK